MITAAKAREAMDILKLEEGYTPEEVKKAYHSAAKTAHPDVGGSVEEFARIDWAKEVLLRYVPTPPKAPYKMKPCTRCNGRGRERRARGYSFGPWRQCVACAGTGDAEYDRDKGEDGI